MDDTNWLSIALATLTPLFIGYFYYHKSAFGNAWMDSISTTDQKVKKANTAITFGVALALSFLLSLFLLSFNNEGINQEGSFDTFQHGAWHGVFVAIAIVTPVTAINKLFERKPWKNVAINIGYWIITLALMGGTLDAMNHWENITIPGMY